MFKNCMKCLTCAYEEVCNIFHLIFLHFVQFFFLCTHNFNRQFCCFPESCGPWFHLIQDDADTFEQRGCLRHTSIKTEDYKLDRLTKIRPGGPFLLSKGLSTTREKLFTGELDLFYWYFLFLFVQILTRDTKAPSTDQCRHHWLVMFLIRPHTDCSNMIKEENWKSNATATTIFIDSCRAQLTNQNYLIIDSVHASDIHLLIFKEFVIIFHFTLCYKAICVNYTSFYLIW